MNIDIKKLRRDLIDYYGTAANSGFPAAMADLIKVENASDSELLEIARKNGFDIKRYVEDMER